MNYGQSGVGAKVIEGDLTRAEKVARLILDIETCHKMCIVKKIVCNVDFAAGIR